MPEWKMSTYGSNETLDLGFFKILIIYRSGTRENPITKSERYEFSINGLVSKKKFGTAEEAKKVALSSTLNRLNAAIEAIKQMQN